MQIYLVGGAVRDALLGLAIKEKDWVVVGSSPEEMLALGFQPVGKEFPVFLHPDTHEEYALARTERKTGKGYKGFTFHADPGVTLEQDLKRRDLTINAMAIGLSGEIIDPYSGQQHLRQKILHHVSNAFIEDPVRILRVARFAAKFPDFTVHSETNELMKKMVDSGEVNSLVAERVWQEFSKALQEAQPLRFFEVLEKCGALTVLFPEIDIDGLGIKILKRAMTYTTESQILFACLLHSLMPAQAKSLIERYRVPKEYGDLALMAIHYFSVYFRACELTPEQMLHFIKQTDALRRKERFQEFLIVCSICLNDDMKIKKINKLITDSVEAIQKIDLSELQRQNLKGTDFARALEHLRLQALMKVLNKKTTDF